MKVILTTEDINHIREVLQLDLKEKAKRVRMCGTNTSDEHLAERITQYNRTKSLINKFETSTATDIFTNEDDMFTD